MKKFPVINGNYVSSLEGVEVGDEFIINRRHSTDKEVVRCTKVTPKQAVVGGYTYRKLDARSIGGSGRWTYPPHLQIADEESLEKTRLQDRKRALCIRFRDFVWLNLSNEKLEQINSIIEAKNENKDIGERGQNITSPVPTQP